METNSNHRSAQNTEVENLNNTTHISYDTNNTNNDIDYTPDQFIPKGTMLYFGVGSNSAGVTAKNARGYHTILITKV